MILATGERGVRTLAASGTNTRHALSAPPRAPGSQPSQGSGVGAGPRVPAEEPSKPVAAPPVRPSTSSSSSSGGAGGSSIGGYTIGRVLGEGGFCQVRQAVHHISGAKVAIKVIDKAKLTGPNDRKRMAREIAVMKRLSHPNIIRCLDCIEATTREYIVMEYATNGSLLDYVRAKKRLSEPEACGFLQQMSAGLLYCHQNNVVHRDVKLENVLLDAGNMVKIIDFGLCAIASAGMRLRVFCGSPSYAAPEIVSRRPYEGPPVDVWSLGVVLFAMVCGYLPFHAQGDKKALCRKIVKGQYSMPEHLSPELQDLIRRMLQLDPVERISMAHVVSHPWTQKHPNPKVSSNWVNGCPGPCRVPRTPAPLCRRGPLSREPASRWPGPSSLAGRPSSSATRTATPWRRGAAAAAVAAAC